MMKVGTVVLVVLSADYPLLVGVSTHWILVGAVFRFGRPWQRNSSIHGLVGVRSLDPGRIILINEQ
jgi:hypothetical protein